ncbi:MAG TPA: hypothetical protein VGF75_02375 [Candidatus Saccharimonadales bacterium]
MDEKTNTTVDQLLTTNPAPAEPVTGSVPGMATTEPVSSAGTPAVAPVQEVVPPEPVSPQVAVPGSVPELTDTEVAPIPATLPTESMLSGSLSTPVPVETPATSSEPTSEAAPESPTQPTSPTSLPPAV